MEDYKSQAVHVDTSNSGANWPEQVPHHHGLSEIDQGNEAVLLRVNDEGGEKGQAGALRLAKDHHVCYQLQCQPFDLI